MIQTSSKPNQMVKPMEFFDDFTASQRCDKRQKKKKFLTNIEGQHSCPNEIVNIQIKIFCERASYRTVPIKIFCCPAKSLDLQAGPPFL